VLKGLVLGHTTGEHGENPREEIDIVKPYFKFWDLKDSRDSTG
jgi:hypothetical protein